MNDYMVRITAGGVSRWISHDPEVDAFTDDEMDAARFAESFATTEEYVLGEAQYRPFDGQRSYHEIGLEKIEFIYVEGE